jgi:hypothetical protein
MAAIDNILAWEWPEDCNAQGGAIVQLLGLLDALAAEWEGSIAPILQLNQATQPTSGDWMALWVSEGRALPITEGARLLWFDTANDTFGGFYTSINGVIDRVESPYYKGKTDLIPFVLTNTTDLNLGTLTQNDFRNPTNFRVQRNAHLLFRLNTSVLQYHSVAYSASNYLRLNYKLNGTFQIVPASPANAGLLTSPYIGSGQTGPFVVPGFFTWMHPDTLTPGDYTLEFFGLSWSVDANRKLQLASPALPYLNSGASVSSYTYYITPTLAWELIYY